MSLLTEQEINKCIGITDNTTGAMKNVLTQIARAVEAKVIEKIKAQGPVAHLYFNEHGTPRVDQQYLPNEDSFPVYRLPKGD